MAETEQDAQLNKALAKAAASMSVSARAAAEQYRKMSEAGKRLAEIIRTSGGVVTPPRGESIHKQQ